MVANFTKFVDIDTFVQNISNYMFTTNQRPSIEIIAKDIKGFVYYCPAVSHFNEPSEIYVLDWINCENSYHAAVADLEFYYDEASREV